MKFLIVESNENSKEIRCGYVTFHANLLHPGERAYGGGECKEDGNRVILSGVSFKFGPPDFSGGIKKFPSEWEGKTIIFLDRDCYGETFEVVIR